MTDSYQKQLSALLAPAADGGRPAPAGIIIRADGKIEDVAKNSEPKVVLSGAFNPLHIGHSRLLAAGAAVRGTEPFFELSASNADGKKPLSAADLAARIQPLLAHYPCIVTNAPLFAEKARIIQNAAFVMGFDTLVRFFDPRFYNGGAAGVAAAADTLAKNGCRILAAGRTDDKGRFQMPTAADVPAEYRSLVSFIPEAQFREDISSTELRRQGNPPR